MLAGRKRRVGLEESFWLALKDIARRERMSIAALVERIDSTRESNLVSALRLFVLNDFRRRAGLPHLPAADRRHRGRSPATASSLSS